MRSLLRVFALVVALAPLSVACAHTMVIETEPAGAAITINGTPQGESPVVTRQFTSTGGRIYVTAQADSYEPTSVVVTQSEWFLWPAVIAVTPLLGVPFVVIPFVGPVITIGWALITSPTLLTLAFLQRYPQRVVITMQPRLSDGVLQPTDTWLIPDEYDPNPPPLPGSRWRNDEGAQDAGQAPPGEYLPLGPPEPQVLPQPKQPEGGNPVP